MWQVDATEPKNGDCYFGKGYFPRLVALKKDALERAEEARRYGYTNVTTKKVCKNHVEVDKVEPPNVSYKFSSAVMEGGNVIQPFEATCAKCGQKIYFDLDTSSTPGFNGDWFATPGDYGCSVDNGENSEDGNGHVPTRIVYNRKLYPRPEK